MRLSKQPVFCASSILILSFLALFPSCSREVAETRFLLGTTCTIHIWGGNQADLEEAFGRIADIEAEMSTRISGSDINRIVPGDTGGTAVSDETCSVIRRGLEFGKLSGGLFDITVGPVVDLWGFGSDTARVPSDEEIQRALAFVDYRTVQVLPDCRIQTAANQKIDLGAIAKGYASDEARRVLQEAGVDRGIINLGGNVLIFGEKKDSSPWKIGIQDPYSQTGATVGVIETAGGAVVTSGIYERFIEQDGKRYHHILNPATGYPHETNLAGVSVSLSSGIDADALSTTLFLLGIDDGCRLLESFPESGAIFITTDRQIVTYGTASDHFTLTNEGYIIIEKR